MKKPFILLFALSALTLHTYAQQDDTSISDMPESMQETTDQLLKSWNMQKYLVVDTTSQLADINPYFTDEVYEDRLRRIPCVMNLTYNPIVRQYIDQYTGRLRHSVAFMLGASNYYIPILEEALAYYQIPLELKYLPVIESALNPRARSHAGAVGLWQFMPKTAKRYNLQLNSLVDERCEPIKASYAAAKYLKDLYDIFGDWTLVIAAYNCGPTNVNKAIHRSGGERDFWKIYPRLPRETRGYVPAFIAANYIMNYYGEHNIQPLRTRIPATTDTILLTRDVRMEKIADVCNIDLNEIKALNPQYQTTLIPGYRTTCTLRLPQEQLLRFIDLQDSIYQDDADNLPLASTQDSSDGDGTDDQFTNSSTSTSQSYNSRYTSSSRKSSSRHSSRSKRSSRRSKRHASKSVTIKDGQTLSEIAERHHTTVAKLRKLNGIKGSSIRAGKKLKVK